MYNVINHSNKKAIIYSQESTVKDYISLLKPGVMSLVVFSGFCGMMLAPGYIHPFIGFTAILCIALGSGASGAINMWYDRDIDLIMKRTQKRPLPAGRILPEDALHFGIMIGFLSVMIMGLGVNYVAASILLIAILFYVFIYTMWLKRRTPQNIVIGGAAGSFPPMIGWASVTGTITVESIILFMIIFMWTPPHFWALSLYKSDEYAKAGIPMLPVVKGYKITKLQMLIYTIFMIITTFLPYVVGMSGVLYLSIAILLGGQFMLYAIRLYLDKSNKIAPKMFKFSILYLFAIFAFMVFDKLL